MDIFPRQKYIHELYPFCKDIFLQRFYVYNVQRYILFSHLKDYLWQFHFLWGFWNLHSKIFKKFNESLGFAKILMEAVLFFHMRHESSNPKVKKLRVFNLVLLTKLISNIFSRNKRICSHQRQRYRARNRPCRDGLTCCIFCKQ